LQATLISKKEIKKENLNNAKNSKSSKKKRTQGTYTNWFAPHLWSPTFAVMKKHHKLTSALHYLKTFHKKLGEVNGP
jgi:hypothetical protein